MSSATATLEASESTSTETSAGFLLPRTTQEVKQSPEITEDGMAVSPHPAVKSPTKADGDFPMEGTERQVDAGSINSSTVDLLGQFRQQHRRTLRPEISQEARQWLNGELDIINQRLMLFCLEQANRMHVSVLGLRLDVKRSWEGEFRELILRVFVEANFAQALALWDSIGETIQKWGTRQPPKLRRLLDEQYAVFVEPMGQ